MPRVSTAAFVTSSWRWRSLTTCELPASSRRLGRTITTTTDRTDRSATRPLSNSPPRAVFPAQKAAEAAHGAAGEKVKQYQDALKKARAQVYAEQEAARKRLLDERAAQLKDVRTKTSHEVSVAKQRIARELAEARREVEASTGQLAVEIARRVLQAPRPGSPVREAR